MTKTCLLIDSQIRPISRIFPRGCWLFALITLLVVAPTAVAADGHIATFSIVARDPQTGDLGVGVQSKYFGVGWVVPHARADIGALATQARGNIL